MTRRVWPLLAAGLTAATLVTVQITTDLPADSPPEVPQTLVEIAVHGAPPDTPSEPVARRQLQRLAHRELPPVRAAGYRRSAFGTSWADVDGNGCSTREDVLAWWTSVTPPIGSCLIVATLVDPYTGRWTSTAEVDIDHVVPLAEAWQAGAWAWSPTRRAEFANDRTNLVPTSGSVNRSKGARTPSGWLPPNRWYWCTYVSVYVGTKYTYGLSVTGAEAARLAEGLDSCRGPWTTDGP